MKWGKIDLLTIVLVIILIIFVLIAAGILKLPAIIKILGGTLGK